MRILLADGQPSVRFALRLLLERQPALTVVGEAVDVESLHREIGITHPDLVLLDWELPGQHAERSQNGRSDLLATLRVEIPDVQIIVMSGRDDARTDALTDGADGFVSKGDPPERVLEAVARCRHERAGTQYTPQE